MEDNIQTEAGKEKSSKKSRLAAVSLILGIFLLGAIGAFIFNSAQKAQALEFEPISFAKLRISHFSQGLSTQGVRVIRTKNEWQDFLKKNGAEMQGFTAQKDYDFNKKVLLVASAGQKPTGGYEMQIKSVEKDGGRIVVTAELSVPGANCQTAQVLTTPAAAVLLSKFQGAISLVITPKSSACGQQDIPLKDTNLTM